MAHENMLSCNQQKSGLCITFALHVPQGLNIVKKIYNYLMDLHGDETLLKQLTQ